jgi:2-polyprenyl-3-methyl-5-hydroxy-6-metoxy-1,4-benzoquinol methylase
MVATWLTRINESPLWHRPVALSGMTFIPPTLDRWVALQAHRLHLMGSTEFKFFQRFVGHESHIVDVGANQGIYTLSISRQAGDGKVFAFEPDPKLFATLKSNVERNSVQNVVLFNAAAASVGDVVIIGQLHVDAEPAHFAFSCLAHGRLPCA